MRTVSLIMFKFLFVYCNFQSGLANDGGHSRIADDAVDRGQHAEDVVVNPINKPVDALLKTELNLVQIGAEISSRGQTAKVRRTRAAHRQRVSAAQTFILSQSKEEQQKIRGADADENATSVAAEMHDDVNESPEYESLWSEFHRWPVIIGTIFVVLFIVLVVWMFCFDGARVLGGSERSLKLFACCSGIILLLGVYGFLQERIMTIPYDVASTAECTAGNTQVHEIFDSPQNAISTYLIRFFLKACLFTWSLLLVFFNRVMTVFFALVMTGIRGDSFAPKCPIWKYALISISNVTSTTCQYEALKYISFPMQMLGKSMKMVPVMIWGIIVSRKEYTVVDWLIAVGVTMGCTGFALYGDASSRAASDEGSSVFYLYMYGMLLMVGYLATDAFTSTFQEYLFKSENTTKYAF